MANGAYWEAERRGNAERDRRARRMLRTSGWQVLTIWECQMKDRNRLAERVGKFLKGNCGT